MFGNNPNQASGFPNHSYGKHAGNTYEHVLRQQPQPQPQHQPQPQPPPVPPAKPIPNYTYNYNYTSNYFYGGFDQSTLASILKQHKAEIMIEFHDIFRRSGIDL